MSYFTMSSSVSFNLFLIANGTRRGGWITGVAFSCRVNLNSWPIVPNPEKTFLYFDCSVSMDNYSEIRLTFCSMSRSTILMKPSF